MITNKEKNFVSAVIYVYNNEDQIKAFLKTIVGLLRDNFEKFEVICVNDSSTDGSADAVRQMIDEYVRLELESHLTN